MKLPREDKGETACGLLLKAMYGTRDAAQHWEHEHTEFMRESGFTQGKTNPCVFYNSGNNLMVVMHGGDFTICRQGVNLAWFREMIRTKFEVHFRAMLGEDKGGYK